MVSRTLSECVFALKRNVSTPSARRKVPSKTLVALAVILAVGVATFVVAEYFGSAQTIGSGSSAISSQTNTKISTGSGSSSESQSQASQSSVTSSPASQTQVSTTYTSISIQSISTESSTKAWSTFLTYPPYISLSSGQPFLNVSYTSNLSNDTKVYAYVILYQGVSGTTIGCPIVTIVPGGRLGLYLPLGRIGPGNYSVEFYLVDYATAGQISEEVSLSFTL